MPEKIEFIVYRDLLPDEVIELEAMIRDFYKELGMTEQARKTITYLAVKVDDKVAGMLKYRLPEPGKKQKFLEVEEVYIKPEYRRTNVATKMIYEVIKRVSKKGIREIKILAMKPAMIALFKKLASRPYYARGPEGRLIKKEFPKGTLPGWEIHKTETGFFTGVIKRKQLRRRRK